MKRLMKPLPVALRFLSAFCAIFSLLLVSCRPASSKQETGASAAYELKVVEQRFSGEEALNLNSYYLSAALSADSVNLLYGYNQKTHALDCFDLKHRTISTLPFAYEGPSAVMRPLRGLLIHSRDSIWLFDASGRALLMNAEGEVLRSISLRERLGKGQDVLVDCNYALSTSRLHYDERHRSLLFGVKDFSVQPACFKVRECFLDGDREDVEYNLQPSKSIPDLSGGDYANLGEVNITYVGDDILYNYPAESHIYVLNRATGAEKVIEADSRYTPNVAEPCTSKSDYSAWIRHGFENPHFYEVSYLPSLRLYARLHLAPGVFDATEKDLNKLLNTRQMYLMLFDDDFRVVDELALPLHRYSYYTAWTMTPDAILWFVDKGDTAEQEEEENCVIDVIVPKEI